MRAKIVKGIVFTPRFSIAGNTGCICQIENFCVGTRTLVRACAERDVSGLSLVEYPKDGVTGHALVGHNPMINSDKLIDSPDHLILVFA